MAELTPEERQKIYQQHDTALWEVNIMTNKVMYRNKYAKGFSWVPKD